MTKSAVAAAENVHLMDAYEKAYRAVDPAAQVRLGLVVAHGWAARWGWNEGVVNHLTALVPGYDDRFYAVPYGVHWSELKACDLLVVRLDGEVVEGEGEIELTSLMDRKSTRLNSSHT